LYKKGSPKEHEGNWKELRLKKQVDGADCPFSINEVIATSLKSGKRGKKLRETVTPGWLLLGVKKEVDQERTISK
jgi:hypothetical protein